MSTRLALPGDSHAFLHLESGGSQPDALTYAGYNDGRHQADRIVIQANADGSIVVRSVRPSADGSSSDVAAFMLEDLEALMRRTNDPR